jgi:hypothetical protein
LQVFELCRQTKKRLVGEKGSLETQIDAVAKLRALGKSARRSVEEASLHERRTVLRFLEVRVGLYRKGHEPQFRIWAGRDEGGEQQVIREGDVHADS